MCSEDHLAIRTHDSFVPARRDSLTVRGTTRSPIGSRLNGEILTKTLAYKLGNFRSALVDFAEGLNEPADGLDQSLIDGFEHHLGIVSSGWIGEPPMRRARPRKCRTNLAWG